MNNQDDFNKPTEISEIQDTHIYSNSNNSGTVFGDPQGGSALSNQVKKLAGMLISYSKDGNGEYWPLYLGTNIIGKSTENNVVLLEDSVSKVHSSIQIRRLPNGDIIFELMDRGSSLGTIINGSDHSDYNNYVKLSNGDNITIGGYRFVFVALDDKALGLERNEDFKSGTSEPDYTII
jgi:hypothetical protein